MHRVLLLCLVPLLAPARDVRLLRLEGPDSIPARLHVIGDGVEAELDLPMLSTSARRLVLGNQPYVLRLAKDKPTPKQPLPADAPVVTIPAGDADLLLVLLAGPGSLGLRAAPVALPDGRGAAGALLWFNLQPRTLHVGLGELASVVVPSGASRVTLPPVAPGAAFAARIDLDAGEPGQGVRPFVRGTWVRSKYGRHILFVVTDPDRAAPRILSVPDTHEPEPPPAPPAPPAPRAVRR